MVVGAAVDVAEGGVGGYVACLEESKSNQIKPKRHSTQPAHVHPRFEKNKKTGKSKTNELTL